MVSAIERMPRHVRRAIVRFTKVRGSSEKLFS
jgi:hypothetical protein